MIARTVPLALTASLALTQPVQAHHCGLYEYKATIVKVYDGDTVWADIDLGFNVTLKNEPLRLHRVDTPEVRGEGKELGMLVRDLVAERILGREVVVCTIQRKDGLEKKGTFHRYLAEIWVDGENRNDWLLEEGHAELDDGT